MSQPDDRSGTPNGSTAFTPLPGQPLAEQPTEVVHRPEDGGWGTHQDTEVMAPSAQQPDAPRFWERHSDDEPEQTRDAGYAGPDDGTATAPDYRDAPVVVRCADSLGGLLLLLAGIAAGLSLLVVWVDGGATGLDLVRDGLDDLTGDQQRLRDSWEPLAVLAGGVVLFLLGLLLFVPARTHRFLGALALLVSLVVAAAVLVPLADADWDLQPWAVGAWFTAAVAVLGFLGALKALMTNPRRR